MGFEGLLGWGFWLWTPDVIWKFVPDHRTSIWKGPLTKGFCFDGGNTKNAVVTGRTELSRWCINPQDPGQIFRNGIWQRIVTEGGYFVLNSSCDWQPMEWVQNGSNMVWFGSFDCESYSCILDSLKSIKKVLRYTREQSITIVQSGKYKGRDDCFGGIDG